MVIAIIRQRCALRSQEAAHRVVRGAVGFKPAKGIALAPNDAQGALWEASFGA